MAQSIRPAPAIQHCERLRRSRSSTRSKSLPASWAASRLRAASGRGTAASRPRRNCQDVEPMRGGWCRMPSCSATRRKGCFRFADVGD